MTAEEVPWIITPDPDDSGCALIMVDGWISGRPFRFVLDTGASRTQIVADDFTANLRSNGQLNSSGVFAPSSDPLVTVSDVSIGPLREATLQVVRVEASPPGRRNLLGMDVLRRRCCHFRFDTNSLVIEPSPAAGTLQPLEMDTRGHFYVDVGWPRAQGRACWDSGAGITVVDRAFFQRHAALFEACASSVGTDSTGAQAEAPTFWVTGPTIGGSVFARHKVAVIDLAKQNSTLDRPMDLILGYTTLSQANWLFDFPTERWGLTRSPATSPESDSRTRTVSPPPGVGRPDSRPVRLLS
jgi:hypothetical protein